MLPGTRNGKSCFPECRGESHSPYCIRPIAFALLHSPYCIHPIVLCPVAFALLYSPYRIRRPIAFALSHSPYRIRPIAFALLYTRYCIRPIPYTLLSYALSHSPYRIRPIAFALLDTPNCMQFGRMRFAPTVGLRIHPYDRTIYFKNLLYHAM